jgi:two-component system, cell cycle sensor histidine kinase and response regulator CckA
MNDRPIRVLLVEDDEEDYLLTRDLFADIANTVYAVDWVATEADAVGQFQQRRHDVYLIDYRLGPANGLELLERANQLRVPAPIIMLTGQGEPEVDMAAMRAGAADFLIKGEITARSLERAVRYAIERKRAEKEIERLAAFPRRNPNPVAEFAPDGTLTYANAAMETLARSLGEETLAAMLPAEARPLLAECLRTNAANEPRHAQFFLVVRARAPQRRRPWLRDGNHGAIEP